MTLNVRCATGRAWSNCFVAVLVGRPGTRRGIRCGVQEEWLARFIDQCVLECAAGVAGRYTTPSGVL